MKKLLIIAVGLLLLALPAVVCGGGADNTAMAGAGCPDGWEAVRLDSVYHGVHLEAASDDCECLGDSTFCVSFEGTIHITIVDERLHMRCGTDMFGEPNQTHIVCATGGDVFLQWDGTSNQVCVKFVED